MSLICQPGAAILYVFDWLVYRLVAALIKIGNFPVTHFYFFLSFIIFIGKSIKIIN